MYTVIKLCEKVTSMCTLIQQNIKIKNKITKPDHNH